MGDERGFRIAGDIIPERWAGAAFIVHCGLAFMFWPGLAIIVGALAGWLPRDWVQAPADPGLAAGATLLVLVAAVASTAVAVKLWRETAAS